MVRKKEGFLWVAVTLCVLLCRILTGMDYTVTALICCLQVSSGASAKGNTILSSFVSCGASYPWSDIERQQIDMR